MCRTLSHGIETKSDKLYLCEVIIIDLIIFGAVCAEFFLLFISCLGALGFIPIGIGITIGEDNDPARLVSKT